MIFKPDFLSGTAGIVTGGSSGIGLGIACFLAQHGAKVTIFGRSQDKLDKAKETIGPETLTVSGDVRKSEDAQACVEQHMQAHGKIDFLVNNAAGNFLCPLEQMSENAFRSVLDIVTMGTFLFSKAVYPHMKAAGAGRIVNIGTTYSWGQASYVAHSGAAKAAVLNLSKTMAAEWGPAGITCNVIAPGPVKGTEGVKRLLSSPQVGEAIKAMMPTPRMAEVDEIASVAGFLISPAGAYINGVAIPVDGGAHLNIPGLLPAGMPIPIPKKA